MIFYEKEVVAAAAAENREHGELVRALWFHQKTSRTTESASERNVADAVVAVVAVHTKFAGVDKEEQTDTFPIVEVVQAETLHSKGIQVMVVHLLIVTSQ